MSGVLKRGAVLGLIFLAALSIFLLFNRRSSSMDEVAYTALEEATLPVVYVDMYGRRMNPMYGFEQDMGNVRARDSLTVLPEGRALNIEALYVDREPEAIRYEIRSLDLEHLVENTDLDDWDLQDGTLRAVLPIQNLLVPETEYLLRIELEYDHQSVYYYTRIVLTEDDTIAEMIDLSLNFSTRTFSYDDARELTTYLETDDSEDNSSFGTTTLHSSFSQLTWGRLRMAPAGDVQVSLREKSGLMTTVTLDYLASRTGDTGRAELYEVEENFTWKYNAIRSYLMDYERKVNQIVTGDQEDFNGKRIVLGITNDNEVSVMKSPDEQIIAYRADRDLWSYNERDRRAVRIFSFRGNDSSDLREIHRDHDIKILSVDDDGNIDFLVYGYQNRGNHEGEFGIVYYHYDEAGNSLEERFFIPTACSLEELQIDMDILSIQTENRMLYLYIENAIYSIDLLSNEMMVVADALEDDSYAVSADYTRIAWQEDGTTYDSHVLHLMDLESGEKKDIRGETDDEFVRVLGFIGRDLVYGIARDDSLWEKNGRVVDLPMYAVEILNDRMQIETRYEKTDYYVAGVEVDDTRIHLNRVVRQRDGDYAAAQEDTIVCNIEVTPDLLEGIGWYASQDKEKVYFVQTSQEISENRSIRVTAPRRLSSSESDRLEPVTINPLSVMRFYAYGSGHLLAVTTNFTAALQTAYSRMGFVTDEDQNFLWDRVDREDSYTITDISGPIAMMERHLDGFAASRSFSDGVILLDARGCDLQQLLYFIGKGMPVFGYTDDGFCIILNGFNRYNIYVYDPDVSESTPVGINDCEYFFDQRGNDFICAVLIP